MLSHPAPAIINSNDNDNDNDVYKNNDSNRVHLVSGAISQSNIASMVFSTV